MDKCQEAKCPVLELFCRYFKNEETILELENEIEELKNREEKAIKIIRGINDRFIIKCVMHNDKNSIKNGYFSIYCCNNRGLVLYGI